MRPLLFLLLLASPLAAQQRDTAALMSVIAAEDARVADPVAAGLRSSDPSVRAYAARALGRLERPALLSAITPALADADARVRSAAAWSLAQALRFADSTDTGFEAARAALVTALRSERDDVVRGALLESLGRMGAVDALVAAAPITGNASRLGAARGLYFAARRGLPQGAATMLSEFARDPSAARELRVTAIAALGTAGAADLRFVTALLAVDDETVRREAVAAAGMMGDTAGVRTVVERAFGDASGAVRYTGLSVAARRRLEPLCDAVAAAIGDVDSHVSLLAIDLAGARCARLAGRLDSIAAALNGGWHRAAHAIVSLAQADARAATARLPAFASHQNGFVRAYAARAARILNDARALRSLAEDADPNVRTAAVEGLAATAGHAADAVYIAQLTQDDGQLLMAAAGALEGSQDARALPSLLNALERVTRAQRETSRDARMALLDRIAELGSAADAPRLAPSLTDFDPAVAERAADVIGAWTGQRPTPSPQPLPHLALPTYEELRSLEDARVRITMESGDSFELRMLPWVAPTNAWRFARLARSGYFDGLTLHRVVPVFVVQGGSPNANEYAGDGPFTRDELGHPNWRGTVGLSTRGRDTGDAQIFINLVDNIRLDTDYTVFAAVVEGMDVVDRILEGDRIFSIREF